MELLAPAGSFDALRAAVQSGADAVYIGGEEFSARRSAANFSNSEIIAACRYCHARGVSLHVAANILIKEKEKNRFIEYLGFLSDVGVDAVIIADIGMAKAAHEVYPDLPLHASTQMTVSSLSAALAMKKMGFSRVVTARELSREAISKICDEGDLEVEVFAHGAICMSYSGQCLMSSIIGGRSGNRGMCAQPCRLPYKIGQKQGYLLSPKDLCMLEHISELEDAKVTSLKIEGRLKRPEYVAAVCGIYRKYLDSRQKPSREDIDELLNAFNRSGFTSGYFSSEIGPHMMSYKNPSNICENVFSAEVKKRCDKEANFRRSEIFIGAEARLSKPIKISMWDGDGHFVTAHGEIPAEPAISNPLTADKLSAQLIKLGNTPFYAGGKEVYTDDNISLPVSEINKTRRRAAELLEEEICKAPKRRRFGYSPYKVITSGADDIILTAEVSDYEQAKTCIQRGITEIYAPTPLAGRLAKEYKNVRVISKLPPILRDDREYQQPITDTILISNIGQYDKNKICIGDFRLNITNSESRCVYSQLERVTMSPELNLKELSGISQGSEIIAYGRIPLMVMENCPLKALGLCQKHQMKHFLQDRKNERFPIRCNEGCVAELLNSKPIFMADKLENVKNLKIRALRLVFTVENFTECGKIIDVYNDALCKKTVLPPVENTFTRGHFYRGVE